MPIQQKLWGALETAVALLLSPTDDAMKQLSWDALIEPVAPKGDVGRPPAGRVLVCSGAMMAERVVLARLRELHQQGVADPRLLARPVIVAVPSADLRLQLIQRVTEHLGGACVGLTVLTLRGLVAHILSRTGGPVDAEDSWFEILARRCAAMEAPLRQAFGELDDGFALAVGTMRDLLSAGFLQQDADALQQICDELPPILQPKVSAIVAACARVRAQLDEQGLSREGDLLERAATVLANQGAAACGARAVLVHGFSDATGQATHLLQQLLRLGATAVISQPMTPAGARVGRGV